MLKSVCSDHACDHSFRVLDRWALARRFFGGNKLVKLVKSGFFELYFLFCLSWTHKCKSAYSFLNLGSYLNMYHGYASLKKEHILPVFTEKRALFQHILRDAKSTKCELIKGAPLGKGYCYLSAPHTIPTSHHNASLLVKWAILFDTHIHPH